MGDGYYDHPPRLEILILAIIPCSCLWLSIWVYIIQRSPHDIWQEAWLKCEKKKHWWMYDHPSGWEKWGHVGHVFEPPRFDQHLRFFSLKGPCFSGPKLPEIPQCRPHDLVSPRLVVTKSSKLMALATGRPKISHPLFFKKLHGKINRKWFGSFCLPVLGQLYKRCPFDVVSWLSLHQV